jgi:polyphosphate kinase
VAVVVELTARFDEAPNIEWGRLLEKEGVHVSYGVRSLKTHAKCALVVRRETESIRRYVHIGTGNYHPGTARLYEDLGLFTADPEVAEDVAKLFNSLTGATPAKRMSRLIVAPQAMRRRLTALIRREAAQAQEGREAGIWAKLNQLQDPRIIRELYAASSAGVSVTLCVRGLCCLRPGVPGMSENIRVISVVGRYLEHSRLFRFMNAGEPEHYLSSADWAKRNLGNRVETMVPVSDKDLQEELDAVIQTYDQDNASAWDCDPDGVYALRRRDQGVERRVAQELLALRAAAGSFVETRP